MCRFATKVVVPGTTSCYILQLSFAEMFVVATLIGSIVVGVPMEGQQLVSVTDRSRTAGVSDNNVYPARKADRATLADALKVNFLKQGCDIQIRAKGKGAKILVVKSARINGPFVFNFSDEGRLIKKLQVAGFMSIHFENGSRVWDQQLNYAKVNSTECSSSTDALGDQH
ncbi:MAG: hypothetical protein JWQ42_4024 [Edaphobacter sp.]|nr:hypothetical protein [Edaphobacter sp.]